MAVERYSIGVDLGTSFTAVAIADEHGPRAAQLSNDLVEPSAVFCADDGTLLTGEAAVAAGRADRSRLVVGVRRHLGDPTPILVAGASYSPEALLAAQLRRIVDSLSEQLGGQPENIVLTCPAAWGPYRCAQLAKVAEAAGVPKCEIVSEAVATATHLAEDTALVPAEVVAVLDIGGRALDASVLHRTADGFDILGTPQTDEHLGGRDFDDAMRMLVDRKLNGRIAALDPERDVDAAALAAIDAACTAAKEELSARTETSVAVPLPDGDQTVTITRDEFEQAIAPLVANVVAALRGAIASAGVDEEDVAAIVLAGGSSRIPLVATQVAEIGRPIHAIHQPKFAVALGAAVVARLRADAGADADGPAGAVAAVVAGPQRLAARLPFNWSPRGRSLAIVGTAVAAVAVLAIAASALFTQPGMWGAFFRTGHSAVEPVAASTPTSTHAATRRPSTSPTPAGVTTPAATATGTPTRSAFAVQILGNGVTPGKGFNWFVESADANAKATSTPFVNGSAKNPQITLTQTAKVLRAKWHDTGTGEFYAKAVGAPLDLSKVAAAGGALVFNMTVYSGSATAVNIGAQCTSPCGGVADLTKVVAAMPHGEKHRLVVPIRCLVANGLKPAAVDTPFLVSAAGTMSVSFGDIRWVSNPAAGPPSVSC